MEGNTLTMTKQNKIRVAIAGVGNCCQALLEGIEHYRQRPQDTRGLMHVEIGGYKVTDIVPVAAFDVNAGKVGKDLSEAIYAQPNRAYRYPGVKVKHYGVKVEMGRSWTAILPTFRSSYPRPRRGPATSPKS
jgi:myo-inositol-1-phosphate synthase